MKRGFGREKLVNYISFFKFKYVFIVKSLLYLQKVKGLLSS